VRDAGGVNLVMENTGGTLAESLTACLPNARIVLIGNAGGREATVDTQDWRLKRVTIIGGGAMRASPNDERTMLEAIASGSFKPIIAQTLPITQVAEAHRLIEANAVFGKIVLLHTTT
jgi:NADPH:quinone reductase-like Zn-dependent oxidoreductase